MITNIVSNGFNWENNINYNLNIQIQFYSYITWGSTPVQCFATGGFLNTMGAIPSCIPHDYRSFSIKNFQQIIKRNTDNKYIIKIEIIISDYANNNYGNNVGASLYLYAN